MSNLTTNDDCVPSEITPLTGSRNGDTTSATGIAYDTLDNDIPNENTYILLITRYLARCNLRCLRTFFPDQEHEEEKTEQEEEDGDSCDTTSTIEYDTLYNDRPDEITFPRRIARYLSRFNWYYPRKSFPNQEQEQEQGEEDVDSLKSEDYKQTAPKLDVAWAYFEHIALPRCLKIKDDKTNKIITEHNVFQRATPGETKKKTMLYPIWETPLTDLSDFGVGVGLYFFSLKFFAIICFVSGVINIPALLYLASDKYSLGAREKLGTLLNLSTVCLDRKWHPCPDCEIPRSTDQDTLFAFFANSQPRYATGISNFDGETLTFIQVSNCEINGVFGFFTYLSLLFVIGAICYVKYLQKEKADLFDEAVQTSSDYSIKIVNPPPKAKDPETWKAFFESKFPSLTVDLCTVVLNNTQLLKALVHRRTLLTKIQNSLLPGIPFRTDDLDHLVTRCHEVPDWKRWIFRAKSPRQILQEIRSTEDEIAALATDSDFDVTGVFVTFDTEEQQRTVLQELTVPLLREEEMGEKYRFEGKVLRVIEPDEPDSIRWIDLDDTFLQKTIQQIITLSASIFILVAGARVIVEAERIGPKSVSLVIVAFNVLAPRLVRLLTSLESHRNESLRTASQYVKITLFRWSITVFIPLYITPFINTLNGDAIIENVKILLVAEMMQKPILQWISIGGLVKRHVLGPRAKDQRRMNLFYAGDPIYIAERYTDISKVLMLTVFYCILYPASFFFASIIFTVYYWVDKFLILRKWKQGPMIGTAVSHLSSFFYKLCFLAYALVAAYVYAQFPYDNACPVDEGGWKVSSSGYVGNVTVMTSDGVVETITNVDSLQSYRFCEQEIFEEGRFPSLEWNTVNNWSWMNQTQKIYSYVFAWTALLVLILVTTTIFKRVYMAYVHPLFFSSYKPNGAAMVDRFREIEASAYIPQITVSGNSFPFLLCNISQIRNKYVGWNDPRHGLEKHNLINDLELIRAERSVGCKVDDGDSDSKPLFSIVREWQ